MKKSILLFLMVVLVTIPSAQAGNDTVLAKVGDTVITMSDFNRIISYQDDEKKKILEQNPTFKATVLQRLVQSKVVSKIAKDKGFDKRSDIREYLNIIEEDFLTMQYITKEIFEKTNVSEEDNKLYYKMHESEFMAPEMVRARHILIKADKSASEDIKKKAYEKIEGILSRIKAGADFAKVADEFSEDGTKGNGGDLGFFPKGRMVPDFERVAFSMKKGEISGIVETQFGFHIVKIEEKKEPAIEPFENVKDKVREKVLNEFRKARVDEFMEKAMKDAKVELNLDPFLPKQ